MAVLTRGERFKDARIVYNRYHKQTMDEVSAATGVSKSLIQSLEDDSVSRSVGYDKVATLARHYHVSIDFLLGLTEDPYLKKSAIDDLGLSPTAISNLKRFCIDPNIFIDTKDTRIKCTDSREPTGIASGLNALLEQKGIFQIAAEIHELQAEISDILETVPKITEGYNLTNKEDAKGFRNAVFALHNRAKAERLKGLILESCGEEIDPNFEILYGTDIIESKKRMIIDRFQYILNVVTGYKILFDELLNTNSYQTFHCGDDEFLPKAHGGKKNG